MKMMNGGQEELAYACFQPITDAGGSPIRKTGAELGTVDSNMVHCISSATIGKYLAEILSPGECLLPFYPRMRWRNRALGFSGKFIFFKESALLGLHNRKPIYHARLFS